ncbi:unnamed protein product [Cercopithifilaria johnstoni]|uniref:BUD13 homolog n=1 Tax=Cercopithifilaria johnstoni TaxID=2874296 RepID=A0A8J2M222_9BILA|nr:unnamed protein product [Cercopithifilaria johnstoni]
MMDDAAKKARDEYLKKYLGGDDKKSTKKHKKKRKKTGLKIYEDDAFADVAACIEQTSSDDDSSKNIEVLEKVKELHSLSKFKPAAFEAVEIKTEINSPRKRHDSSSDENVVPDEISLPTTSSKVWESASVKNKDCSIDQKIAKQTKADSNISFPVQKIKDEPLDSDASPPRRPTNYATRNFNDDDSDVSPPRRRQPTNNSDSDLSPPRKHDDYHGISNRRKEFGDYEHQKRRRSSSVDSCRHKGNKWDSNASLYDKSVERRRKHYGEDRDKSSSRLHRRREGHQGRKDSFDDSKTSHHSKCNQTNDDDDDVKPMIGKSTGLRTLESHREEMKRLQDGETKLLKNWDEYTSGKNAAVIRRAKLTGKEREKKEREAKKQQELEEKYKIWNKGLRQLEERTQKLNEMARVAQEDFTRHADDKAMNEHLKKQLHEKDPMYKYVKKKKENAEIKTYPKYKGSWPPNRFNIAPGYRWDGVNRSNGFEDLISQTANRKVAQHTEYYENIAKYEV